MAQTRLPTEVPIRYLPRSRRAGLLFGLLVILGLAAFLLTLLREPQRAWQAYVVNWLYFTSLAAGAMAFSAATVITKAQWNWSVRRIGFAFSAFLPISFLLLLPMLIWATDLFPWIEGMASDPILQRKAAYLNLPFLVTRNLVGILLLFGLFLYMSYLALRPDMGLVRSGGSAGGDPARQRWMDRLSQGWRGQEREEMKAHRRLRRAAPAAVLLYAVVMSVIAFDWVMSLEPHWFSTIFGAWFFMGALWGGVAATAWAAVHAKRSDPDLNRLIGPQQLHDLGKLTFAFTVFWAYLFWSQYLVIWYGKLPHEQAWIIHRAESPWGAWSTLALVLCFILPFAGLLGRKAKMTPWSLRLFATVLLLGLWLERYLMVAPSLYQGGPTLTLWEPAIGLLFLGLFLGSVRWFLATFPALQIWQPMVDAEALEAEVEVVGGA